MHLKCERTCIVCKEKHHQSDMMRIYKINNSFQIGEKSYGRGAYICKKTECTDNLIKSKALNRAFKCNVSVEEYNKLREIMLGIHQN